LKIIACDFMPKICFLLPKRFLQQFSPSAASLRCCFPKMDIGFGHKHAGSLKTHTTRGVKNGSGLRRTGAI